MWEESDVWESEVVEGGGVEVMGKGMSLLGGEVVGECDEWRCKSIPRRVM